METPIRQDLSLLAMDAADELEALRQDIPRGVESIKGLSAFLKEFSAKELGYYRSDHEGMKSFPIIWTIFLTKDKDYFVAPWTLRELRYRCLFTKTEDSSGKSFTVYFHLNDKEVFEDLEPLPKKIYFYGAYNRVLVVQMRSYGEITEVEKTEEKERIIQILTDRLMGKKTVDSLKKNLKLELDKKEEALRLLRLKTGRVFRFTPLTYSYSTYEL